MPYSIVIPAYNEGESIAKVLAEIQEKAPEAEIIVVNDCSTDSTPEVVGRFKKVRLITHKTNQGPIQAIVTGIEAAKHEVVVSLDADGQHPVADLPRLVNPILLGQADIVLGSRSELPRLGETIIARASGVKDATTGYRAMRKSLVNLLIQDQAYGGMLLIKAKKRKLRILEVPIEVQDRIAGFSVHSNYTILKKSLKFAWWAFWYQFKRLK